jgi:4-hydroxy-3-methylbut-2-enyl diphosphate reductase IspH
MKIILANPRGFCAGDRDVVAAQEGKVAVEGERLEWRRHVDRLE